MTEILREQSFTFKYVMDHSDSNRNKLQHAQVVQLILTFSYKFIFKLAVLLRSCRDLITLVYSYCTVHGRIIRVGWTTEPVLKWNLCFLNFVSYSTYLVFTHCRSRLTDGSMSCTEQGSRSTSLWPTPKSIFSTLPWGRASLSPRRIISK